MEKKKIKIAALQMESVIGNVSANHKKVGELLDNNLQENDVDIIVLPEVWTVGWDCEKFQECSEQIVESKTIEFLQRQAIKYNSYIIAGSFIEKENDVCYNTCPVISPKGEFIAKYRKNHLFSYYGCNEGHYVNRGEDPILVDILGYKIGLSICYDIRFPEIYRSYRKAGADIMINMAAWPLGRRNHWLALTRARAVENQAFFVALTQTGLLSDGSSNLGHSLIYDYNGEILDELVEKEGVICAEISTESMLEFRNKCTVLDDIQDKYEVIKC